MLLQVNGITLHDSDHYEAVDVLKSSGNDITMVVGREIIVPRKTEEDEEDEEEEEEREEQIEVKTELCRMTEHCRFVNSVECVKVRKHKNQLTTGVRFDPGVGDLKFSKDLISTLRFSY